MNKIVQNAVKSLEKKYRSKAQNILIGIGPGIRECHFDILEKNIKLYKDYPDCIIKKDNKTFIDLAGVIKEQLIAVGVKKENIEDSKLCTYCLKDKYFSYRRDRPKVIEAMIAYIGLK